MTDETLETLCEAFARAQLGDRADRWARADPGAVRAAADQVLARWEATPASASPHLATHRERAVIGRALLAIGGPFEPRWDVLLPFAWGSDAINEALAAAIGPERTVGCLLRILPLMYDVHAVRLALAMLPTHPDPALVRTTLDILGKKGFGAQYPKAKAERDRLRGLLVALGERDPRVAAAIAAGPTPRGRRR